VTGRSSIFRRALVAALTAVGVVTLAGSPVSADTPPVSADAGMCGDVAIALRPDRGGYGTTDRAGTRSSALEAEGQRRGKDPAETSGGFVYRKGRYTPLGVVPGAVPLSGIPDFPDATTFSTHYTINNRGETAGNYADTLGDDGFAPPGSTHGFVKSRRGDVTTFDVPGAGYLFVNGSNNRGQVVGDYGDSGAEPGPDGLLPPGSVHGFVRDRDGTLTTFDVPFPYLHAIRDINDRGQMVGNYDDPTNYLGFGGGFLREPDGEITKLDVPGAGPFTVPWGINNRGQVVGWYADEDTTVNPDGSIPPDKVHGFVWDDGEVTELDVPGSLATYAYRMNNRGQVVGAYNDAAGTEHGFLLANGEYTTLDAPGRTYTLTQDINDRGEILIPEGTIRGFPVATTDPDPSGDQTVGFVLDQGRYQSIDLPGDGTRTTLTARGAPARPRRPKGLEMIKLTVTRTGGLVAHRTTDTRNGGPAGVPEPAGDSTVRLAPRCRWVASPANRRFTGYEHAVWPPPRARRSSAR
jgi:probable HAF family extracellular repeat protein